MDAANTTVPTGGLERGSSGPPTLRRDRDDVDRLRRRNDREPDTEGPAASRLKRALDVAAVVVTGPVTVPLGLALAAAVRVTSPGPALFRQERVGLAGRPFRMLKFRTMVVDAEQRLADDPELRRLYLENDHKVPAELDPRLTRIGRLLRRTSLDELPQLLNVLAGSMSLVGPRPVEATQYAAHETSPLVYRRARPGMTGWWQVNGRSTVSHPARAQQDLHYVTTWSHALDLRILLRTPLAVLRGLGAH